MKKFKTLILLISIMASAVMFASCSKDDENGVGTIFVYGVGDPNIEYQVKIEAVRIFNGREYGFNTHGEVSFWEGSCNNIKNNIEGTYNYQDGVFIARNIRSDWTYSISVTTTMEPIIECVHVVVNVPKNDAVWVNISNFI